LIRVMHTLLSVSELHTALSIQSEPLREIGRRL